jgi:hypothetical protein
LESTVSSTTLFPLTSSILGLTFEIHLVKEHEPSALLREEKAV